MEAGPLAALAVGVEVVVLDVLLPHDATKSIAVIAISARHALEMSDNR
jgi:hypothetical protein